MIRRVEIEGFKSVAKASLELGRVNVLIGENGAGKSNFLEALAIGGAAAADKLDHEFLNARGIRVVSPELMVSAFGGHGRIRIRLPIGDVESEEVLVSLEVTAISPSSPLGLRRPVDGSAAKNDGGNTEGLLDSYPILREAVNGMVMAAMGQHIASLVEGQATFSMEMVDDVADAVAAEVQARADAILVPAYNRLTNFLIYSPEYTSLRIFRDETQILPLGIRGEGLFAHLKALSKRDDGRILKQISDELDLIDWFDGFEMPGDLAPGERTLRIRDRYLVEQQVFDQRSANEGFLFLLFYFTLIISPDTPKFFAIDNIDASLNPKLCQALIRRMVALAEAHDKQLILTTHNPAVLDGLDLSDDEQRLFAVSRDSVGRSRLRRVPAPTPIGDDAPMRLSEAFLKGYLGGLPKNF